MGRVDGRVVQFTHRECTDDADSKAPTVVQIVFMDVSALSTSTLDKVLLKTNNGIRFSAEDKLLQFVVINVVDLILDLTSISELNDDVRFEPAESSMEEANFSLLFRLHFETMRFVTQLFVISQSRNLTIRMSTLTALVSVGTTQFDALIDRVLGDDVLKALKDKGVAKLIVQHGNSPFDVEKGRSKRLIDVESFAFVSDLRTLIATSDLVISHAGAGTCLEVQRLQGTIRPRHLVVVNETLMNNHQSELAEKLSNLGHLKHCNVDDLADAITNFDFDSTCRLPEGDPDAFLNYVESVL